VEQQLQQQHLTALCHAPPRCWCRCLAVAEVIVLERNSAGVIKGEYSLGWAMLKLYQVRCRLCACVHALVTSTLGYMHCCTLAMPTPQSIGCGQQ
jgi:hypothetical protein